MDHNVAETLLINISKLKGKSFEETVLDITNNPKEYSSRIELAHLIYSCAVKETV